jgi:hypothetical protein
MTPYWSGVRLAGPGRPALVVTRSSCRLALTHHDLRNGMVGYLVRLGRVEFSAGDHMADHIASNLA